MYLKNVNRGISFTKAGVYTIGLVLILGLLATSSGSNAFFIALGFGLSLLIISGLLSERSMKHFRVLKFGSAVAEAGKPFTVPLSVKNESENWFLFGIESLALTELPSFKLFNAKLVANMEARLLSLSPGETREIQGRSSGLPRGYYEKLFLVQRTLFPFGLISKFKVSEAQTSICVLPEVDQVFLEQLTRDLDKRLHGRVNEEDFHSHRIMTPRDSRRHVDWKKNAGKAPAQWVVRVYQSPHENQQVVVQIRWGELKESASSEAYERLLSRLRTACEALVRSGRTPLLRLEDDSVLATAPRCLDYLARFPSFEARSTSYLPSSRDRMPAAPLALNLSAHSHEWRSEQ